MQPSPTLARKNTSDANQPHPCRPDAGVVERLGKNPNRPIRARILGAPCAVKVVIPEYRTNIERHYADVLRGETLNSVCRRADVEFGFDQFGVELHFDTPTEIAVHDQDLVLDGMLREIVSRFGPVVLKNAYLPSAIRTKDQRNIFPHLNFHHDRGPNQPTQYSLFSRDPFDAVQRQPRASSTVFIANIVGILQCRKDAKCTGGAWGLKSSYEIFGGQPTAALIGDIWMEHAWNQPAGTGEISILDNRTVLHASYYRDQITRGYPIGVRYLR